MIYFCVKQVYNPLKPTKFGIKIYQLCEADSAYCIAFEVYAGKTEERVGEKTYNLIFRMLESSRLLNKGYSLYGDR